jgi:hypothetical protein
MKLTARRSLRSPRFGCHTIWGVETPEWVLDYFFKVAENVRFLASETPDAPSGIRTRRTRQKRTDKARLALVRAFGFYPGGVDYELHRWLHLKGVLRNPPGQRETPGDFDPLNFDEFERTLAIAEYVADQAEILRVQGTAKDDAFARAKQSACRYFRRSRATNNRALAECKDAEHVHRSVRDDLELCMKSGLSQREAIQAVAEERAADPRDVRKDLARPDRRSRKARPSMRTR